MFEYLNNKIQEAEFVDSLKEQVKFIELKDFFSSEHVKRLTDDVHDSKHLTSSDSPIDGDQPSIISFADMVDNDESGFYESLYYHFASDETKTAIFKKFGLTNNYQEVNDRVKTSVSFHTEYPHQIDNCHTDQKDNLFTISLQVYLPTDDSLKDYGTVFIDSENNELRRTEFLPNTGYCFLAHNNSWHEPVTGAERKSFFVRYSFSLNLEQTQTIYNYNSENKVCHVIWNKLMDVHRKNTDWMCYATLQNVSDLGAENIAVTAEPFKRGVEVLHDLKTQGFEKAIVYFGGYIWHDADFFKYVQDLDLTQSIVGTLKESKKELLRQCFVINLNRLDEAFESYSRNKFFDNMVQSNDFVDITDKDLLNRSYYHPEGEHGEYISRYLGPHHLRQGHTNEIPDDFRKEIKYLDDYKTNNTVLLGLLSSIRQF